MELTTRKVAAAQAREGARQALTRRRTVTDIKSLARTHTWIAVNTLVQIMQNEDAPPAARVAAANAILDRGWGKPAQPIENGENGPLRHIHRIERVIVHPGQPDLPIIEIVDDVPLLPASTQDSDEEVQSS